LKSIASAPAKVILFGEHFIVYGGKAILCAINKRITVESELIDSNTIQIHSDLGSIVTAKDEPIKNIDVRFRPIVFVAQKILKQFESKSGLRISITSEIPAGVGLGSSSACCVAATSSISGLFAKYSKEDIVKLALEAERTVFENASGADTVSCTFGGILEYTKQGTKRLEITPKFQIVIANSKMTHSTSEVVSRVRQFKEKHPDEFSILCENESSLIEDSLDSLKRNELRGIGKLMLVNQTHLQKIGVSNQTLDSMIESVKEISYGAKITGAGDGGCIVVLVDDSNLKKTLESLSKYECFATKIDMVGVEQNTA
jgi:mevalonate kinase